MRDYSRQTSEKKSTVTPRVNTEHISSQIVRHQNFANSIRTHTWVGRDQGSFAANQRLTKGCRLFHRFHLKPFVTSILSYHNTMKPVKSLFWVCFGMAVLSIAYIHAGIVALRYYTNNRNASAGSRKVLDKVCW